MRNDGDYGTGDCGERERAGVAARADYCDAAVSPLQCRSRCSNGATSKLSTAADFTLSHSVGASVGATIISKRTLRCRRRCRLRRGDETLSRPSASSMASTAAAGALGAKRDTTLEAGVSRLSLLYSNLDF